MNKEIKIKSSDELKTYWNEFENLYSNYLENNLIPIYTIMVNLLKAKHIFRSANDLNILELSIGTGEGLYYLICMAKLNNTSNKRINIHATDIAPNMVESAYLKLKQIDGIGLAYKDIKTEQKFINVFLSEADNEKLPFEDNYFDIVFSNLSLHIVAHTDVMLKECSRVTKANSWNCFSVWGKKEGSLMFTMFDDTLKKIGVIKEESNTRSNFHLGQDDEELEKLVLSNGYTKINLSHCFIPLNVREPTDYDFIYDSPSFQSMFTMISNEKIFELKEEIYKIISEVLERNELFGLDALIILCKK
jgi:ubiquinone/menaquinone biosynthesis C-methylase UbiE